MFAVRGLTAIVLGEEVWSEARRGLLASQWGCRMCTQHVDIH